MGVLRSVCTALGLLRPRRHAAQGRAECWHRARAAHREAAAAAGLSRRGPLDWHKRLWPKQRAAGCRRLYIKS
eukprot:1186410-Prymnesium_polylepis.1